MFGPDEPTSYELAKWLSYLDALKAYPEYPGKADDIARTGAMIARIERSYAETGKPPTAMEILRDVAAKMKHR